MRSNDNFIFPLGWIKYHVMLRNEVCWYSAHILHTRTTSWRWRRNRATTVHKKRRSKINILPLWPIKQTQNIAWALHFPTSQQITRNMNPTSPSPQPNHIEQSFFPLLKFWSHQSKICHTRMCLSHHSACCIQSSDVQLSRETGTGPVSAH